MPTNFYVDNYFATETEPGTAIYTPREPITKKLPTPGRARGTLSSNSRQACLSKGVFTRTLGSISSRV